MPSEIVPESRIMLGGMTCDHCVAMVEKALLAVSGVRAVAVDLASQSASVKSVAPATLLQMKEAVAAAGYAPQPVPELVTLSRAPTEPASQQSVNGSEREQRPPGPSVQDHWLTIEGMTCASCVGSVQQAAERVEGVESCEVSLTDSSAHLRLDSNTGTVSDVIESIRSAGYGATKQRDSVDEPDAVQAWDPLRLRLAVSAVLSVPILTIAMSHGLASFPGSTWVQFALTVPVVFYGGAPFYLGAWNAARYGRADMNTLIALGTGSAFAFSAVSTLAPDWLAGHGTPGVYFETAAAIITLVLVGRVIEARARRRTSRALRKLVALQAKAVLVRGPHGETLVPLEQVNVGDEVVVHPGDRIPVDGAVVEGQGAVDESPITGESVPVDKAPGHPVLSGSLNSDGYLVVRAETVGSKTALARIIEFVRRALASKAPAARLADRIAGVFVPVILVVACVTLLAWLAAGPAEDSLRLAVINAVSVLIVACPCALGLATPAALAVGLGRAAECGILIRDGKAFETAKDVDTVVFDKTGTLTLGKLAVTDVATFGGMTRETLLESVSAIESRSEHPIAKSIVAASPEPRLSVSGYRAMPGAGASADLEGFRWLLGKPGLLADRGVDTSAARELLDLCARQGKTIVLAARDGRLAGLLALRDTIRPETPGALAELHRLGIRTVMLSGDSAEAAHAIASQAGIGHVIAPVMPVDKSSAIGRLQSEGRTVAMVGDGINDAPALTQADLGMAIGAGTDIAVECANVVLVRSNPADVGRAIELARRTRRTIWQNYFWAFGYNILGVPVAAGVLYPWTGLLLSPVLASAAMALSSVSVLANSLRLNRVFAARRHRRLPGSSEFGSRE